MQVLNQVLNALAGCNASSLHRYRFISFIRQERSKDFSYLALIRLLRWKWLVHALYIQLVAVLWLGSFSNNVFERRTATGNGRNFDQIFRQIVSMRVTTLENTNSVASRHIKRENASTPVEVHRPKPFICLSSPFMLSVHHPAGCGKKFVVLEKIL